MCSPVSARAWFPVDPPSPNAVLSLPEAKLVSPFGQGGWRWPSSGWYGNSIRPAAGTLLLWLPFPGKEGPGPRRWKGILFREKNMGLGRPLQPQDQLLESSTAHSASFHCYLCGRQPQGLCTCFCLNCPSCGCLGAAPRGVDSCTLLLPTYGLSGPRHSPVFPGVAPLSREFGAQYRIGSSAGSRNYY